MEKPAGKAQAGTTTPTASPALDCSVASESIAAKSMPPFLQQSGLCLSGTQTGNRANHCQPVWTEGPARFQTLLEA